MLKPQNSSFRNRNLISEGDDSYKSHSKHSYCLSLEAHIPHKNEFLQIEKSTGNSFVDLPIGKIPNVFEIQFATNFADISSSPKNNHTDKQVTNKFVADELNSNEEKKSILNNRTLCIPSIDFSETYKRSISGRDFLKSSDFPEGSKTRKKNQIAFKPTYLAGIGQETVIKQRTMSHIQKIRM